MKVLPIVAIRRLLCVLMIRARMERISRRSTDVLSMTVCARSSRRLPVARRERVREAPRDRRRLNAHVQREVPVLVDVLLGREAHLKERTSLLGTTRMTVANWRGD